MKHSPVTAPPSEKNMDVSPKKLDPFDAVMLVSYGGPNGPDDVLPFMRNATKGAGIPDERLVEVSRHYEGFGGVSPINARNRELRASLGNELSARGVDVPVVIGNRNWHPFIKDTLGKLYEQGHRNVLALFTSAYASYSGCRQYLENIEAALCELNAEERIDALDPLKVTKVRAYANTLGFVQAYAESIGHSLKNMPAHTHVAMVTHSIPVAMNDGAGPNGENLDYVRQHQLVAAAVMRRVAATLGYEPSWDLSYCSRSGPPQARWLEPDINDHLSTLAAGGVSSVLCVPIGFITDHMEVVYDLDTEAAQTAADLGIQYRRAATISNNPVFVDQLVQLLFESAAINRGEHPVQAVQPGTFDALAPICSEGCCTYFRTAVHVHSSNTGPRDLNHPHTQIKQI
ncbi:MAG: ferrochelatase [Actinomycetaceae bacterium]|nr:ferrochelatase [Actinomycetaceae bacterium]